MPFVDWVNQNKSGNRVDALIWTDRIMYIHKWKEKWFTAMAWKWKMRLELSEKGNRIFENNHNLQFVVMAL